MEVMLLVIRLDVHVCLEFKLYTSEPFYITLFLISAVKQMKKTYISILTTFNFQRTLSLSHMRVILSVFYFFTTLCALQEMVEEYCDFQR
jgi:hypothetical protein